VRVVDRADATDGRIRSRKVRCAAVWTSTAVTPSWRAWKRGYSTLVGPCSCIKRSERWINTV